MSDSSTQAGDEHNTILTTKKYENGRSNSKEMMILYKECLKNHAASLGSHSTDGCGEFMPPSGDNDAFLCSACGCHRNFHRKEEVEVAHVGSNNYTYLSYYHYQRNTSNITKNQVQECHQDKVTALTARHGSHNSPSLNVGPAATPSENDGEQIMVEGMKMSKKRHRTRFTNEQKEKMLGFAQKTNWKIQRVDEGLVQQFCQEVGIKRRVLKIWMHNNKYLFVKKGTNSTLNDHDASDSSDKLNE
ncbi:zinc-finger homeodomain protein 4-like [Chenopodium quinoa]|uniref:ZF-HD dimerization-type domain-containing protein n=1 Tax=Chenopodium quinoa TaxID=63459 RepID=A0A803KNK0_CHEQI|nr:zinc-finger homeodomain protein 4-like [Chenopodium quinoa]